MSDDLMGDKLPVAGQHRLHRGVLGVFDIAAATMANIGPAMSFYFGFGFLAYTAGVASPLTILVAGIAIAILGNTLSEFTRSIPSTGGFITFVGKTFGARAAVTTALMTGAGYMAAMASVIAISGGFFQIVLQYYNVKGLESVPWGVWTLVFLVVSGFLMARGVKLSTKVAGLFFAFEIAVMFIVSIIALVKFHAHISLQPFNPAKITNGFTGLAAGFPLAIYLFIGWENSAALAEETDNPRRNVPRAVFASVAIMTFSYLFFAFATVVGFKQNVGNLSSAAIPFISVAHGAIGALAFFAYIAGLTSTLGALIAGTNSQARLVFNAGREGLLPQFIGKVNQKHRTPTNAMFFFLAVGCGIIVVWGLGHLLGHNASAGMNAVNFFAEVSTFGTILVLVVYFLTNLALPFYYVKNHRDKFNAFKHVILPLVGEITIGVPMYYLVKPGQSAPYSWFPWAALAFIAVAVVYASVLVARDPKLGDRVGSLIADH
jgi:amino acid transporter